MSRSQVPSRDQSIRFPHGLIGLPGLTSFTVRPGGDDGPISLLQSEQRPAMRFPIIDPLLVRPDYEVILTPEEMHGLEATQRSDVEVYVLLTVPADPCGMTANLRAPILVNRKRGVGIQLLLSDPSLPVRASIVQELIREEVEMLM